VLVQKEIKNGIKNEKKAKALHYCFATKALWSVTIYQLASHQSVS